MSPGKTMVRVYDLLKARVMAGEFAPGARLDPMVLRRDFGSSATPVRDALHRLTGERIIESWRNEGFRIAHLSEAVIRDLTEWGHELTHVVIKAASRHTLGPAWAGEAADYPGQLRAILTYLALWSRSPEHRWAICNLSDRCALLWRAEATLLEGAQEEVKRIETALSGQSWAEVSKSLDHLHRKRVKAVPDIAAWVLNRREEFGDNVF